LFVNRQAGAFDAPISIFEGDQSCLVASMIDISMGRELLPRTTFRNGSLGVNRYLYPVLVRVQNKEPGETLVVQVRVHAPPVSPEESPVLLAQSSVFEVTLGTEEEPGIPVGMLTQSLQSPIPTSCARFGFERGDGHILLANEFVTGFKYSLIINGAELGDPALTNRTSFRVALHLVEPGFPKLFPETNFKAPSGTEGNFLHPVTVPVPGRKAGDTVKVQLVLYPADPSMPPLGSSGTFEVVLGPKEFPGLISWIATAREVTNAVEWADCLFETNSPPCEFPAIPRIIEATVHGDHVMLYPHGLGANTFNFHTEYSEDLVSWSVLPSTIRDTVGSSYHRFYRVKVP